MLRDGLCPTIADVAAGLRMDAPIETLIPEGADPNYWRGLVNRYNDKASKPKKRRKSSKRATGSKRRPTAAQVLAGQVSRAMIEALDRVNGQA